MTDRRSWAEWVAPLLVGAAAATAAETSMSLLLYSGPGLVRSLTVVLTVQAAALGVGVWSAPGIERPDFLEAVRRRWLISLGAFLLATLYSAFWSVLEPVGGESVGQGFGLALMAALPLFACGSVLGGLANVDAFRGAERASSIGSPALAGAVVAFVATGIALPRALAPASLFLACLILLSGGGLAWGGFLDRRPRTRLVAERGSRWGPVCVEDHSLPADALSVRVLTEDGRARRWMDGSPTHVPWDVAALRGWAASRADGGSVLVVGGGASDVWLGTSGCDPAFTVEAFERNEVVAELARVHLAGEGDHQEATLHTGNLEDRLEELASRSFDLVLLDAAAFEPVGGLGGISRAGYARIVGLVGPGGALVAGPLADGRPLPEGWTRIELRRPTPQAALGVGVEWPEVERLSVALRASGATWSGAVDGFELIT